MNTHTRTQHLLTLLALSLSLSVCVRVTDMGIKDLIPKCLRGHFDTSVKSGVPHKCDVLIDEVMLLVYKYASIEEEETTLLSLLEMMARLHRRFVQEGGRYLVLTADDSRYVPKQKSSEQRKRSAGAMNWMYPPGTELEPAIVEHIAEDGTRTYKRGPGGVRLLSTYVNHDGQEVNHAISQSLLSPRKVIASRYLRSKLVEQFFLYIKSDISTWPRHTVVFLDGGPIKEVEMLTPNTCVVLPELSNTIGEGEIKAVHWYAMLSASPKHAKTAFVIKTKDTDALAVSVLQFWETSERMRPLYWMFAPGEYVDVHSLIADLKRRGWSKILFATSCILCGTDYSTKKLTSHFIGFEAMWKCWCDNESSLLDEVANTKRVDRLDEDTKHKDTVEMKAAFDTLVRVLYGAAAGCKNPFAFRWDDVRDLCVQKKKFVDPSPGTINYTTGWAECRWTLDYWLSLGEIQSDIIITRGQFNLESSLIEEKLCIRQSSSSSQAITKKKVTDDKDDDDEENIDEPNDDDKEDVKDLETVNGHAPDLMDRFLKEKTPHDAIRESYEMFIKKTTQAKDGFKYSAPKRVVVNVAESTEWIAKKKKKRDANDDCVHPSKTASLHLR